MEKRKADPSHARQGGPMKSGAIRGKPIRIHDLAKCPFPAARLPVPPAFSSLPETFRRRSSFNLQLNPLRRALPSSSQWLPLLLLWPRPSRRSPKELTSTRASLLRVPSAARSLTAPSLLSMCMLCHQLHTSDTNH